MRRLLTNRWASGVLLSGWIGSTWRSGCLEPLRSADGTLAVHLTNDQDRRRLMDDLKITSLRPGRNGSNEDDPNYANYDESKANPHPNLPDPLTLKNGKKITKASDWWSKRRPEIIEDFLKYASTLHSYDLPVDSRELIALWAPRTVFIGAGRGGYDAEPGGDSWVDAKGSFLAAPAAGTMYQLLGNKPTETSEFPPIETLVGVNADLAFRQHSGAHTDVLNWPYFLEFAGKHIHDGSRR
jgi:hypothetical protein